MTTLWFRYARKERSLLNHQGTFETEYFEKGKWTLELWFEMKNTNRAFKLAENRFEIN